MPATQEPLFALRDPLAERLLREMNPWWQGLPVPNLQPVKRWAYASLLRGLNSRLAPVLVLRGSRQVGKSTLQNQVIDELLRQGVDPRRILRVQFDDADSRGLRAFIEKSHYNAPFGLMVTLDEAVGSDDPRIVSLPLSSLLLMR